MDSTERDALRKRLVAARQALPDRLERAVQLQSALRVWLVGRREATIGAYWPIKGEFDALPALYRWTEGAPDGVVRRIGLPVADRATGSLRFHTWYPGCPMELDAYDIPKPKDTEEFVPAAAGGALPRLRTRRRAPGLRRGLLRPHAAVDPAAARHGGRELHPRLPAAASPRSVRT